MGTFSDWLKRDGISKPEYPPPHWDEFIVNNWHTLFVCPKCKQGLGDKLSAWVEDPTCEVCGEFIKEEDLLIVSARKRLWIDSPDLSHYKHSFEERDFKIVGTVGEQMKHRVQKTANGFVCKYCGAPNASE